jgi:hypothetical protein
MAQSYNRADQFDLLRHRPLRNDPNTVLADLQEARRHMRGEIVFLRDRAVTSLTSVPAPEYFAAAA